MYITFLPYIYIAFFSQKKFASGVKKKNLAGKQEKILKRILRV